MSRTEPNVLITGTPGTGKTSTCDLLGRETGLRVINVGAWVKEQELHEGWDEELQVSELMSYTYICAYLGSVYGRRFSPGRAIGPNSTTSQKESGTYAVACLSWQSCPWRYLRLYYLRAALAGLRKLS